VPRSASPLRDARLAAGLSQAEVATAAGVSRQAVGAIEAGRHRPSVDAALAISRAIGAPVERLFGDAPSQAQPVAGAPLPDGAGALVARVGDQAVYAPASGALGLTGWPDADAVMEDGQPRLLPGGDLDGLVAVGCDPALGLLASLLPRRGPRRLIALSGSTAGALEAMQAGRAHAALVHDRAGHLPAPPPGALRLQVARWRVGLASRGSRPRSVAELCRRGARVVQREDGASSQKALVAAVAAEGGGPLDGPRASSHLEVARRVADGAPAGVTMEPAALQHGLAFCPLEEHVAELWVDARWRTHAGVEAAAEALRSSAFTTRLGLVGGYEVAGSGSQRGTGG
jgi:DNA-binding XRE family transcriptional regulator